MAKWTTNSWQQKPCVQEITYPEQAKVASVVKHLQSLPPLVTPFEINHLKQQLAKAARGEAFLLQGGDCAESFANCRSEPIVNKLKILLQMSLILIHGLRKPLIRVGRIAGQYAKPRSDTMETINGQSLPSYRGDLINKPEFTKEARTPDPSLMIQGHQYAALSLNYIRALVEGGFADLQHPELWNLGFMEHSPLADEYRSLVNSIEDTVSFISAIEGIKPKSLNRVDFFTSHEALNLYYEQSLTRLADDGLFYNLSTHFPWIGMRTADLSGSHVEFFRGIENPIAIKVGPSMDKDALIELTNILNPNNEAGRLTFIVRLGVKHVATKLPELIDTIKSKGKQVLWSCDPMHGNTQKTSNGTKTRRFDDILSELQQSFSIHKEMNSHLGGVHFELTGENVTECTGGARGLGESDLAKAYETLLDPRLNYEQSLEMAMLIAKHKF